MPGHQSSRTHYSEKGISNFMDSTGIFMVMGYDSEVDWLVGIATDPLLLESLQFTRIFGDIGTHLEKTIRRWQKS
jgi:hypothetical protein